MTMNAGAVHEVSASGLISLNSPDGLSIELTNIPSYVSVEYNTPREFVGLARIAIGSEFGWMLSIPLNFDVNLIMDLPDGMTRLGLTLAGPVGATVTELWESLPPAGMLGTTPLGAFRLGTARAAA